MEPSEIITRTYNIFHENIQNIIDQCLPTLNAKARSQIGRLSLEKQFRATISPKKIWEVYCGPYLFSLYPNLEPYVCDNNFFKVKNFVFFVQPWSPTLQITDELLQEPTVIWFHEFVNKYAKYVNKYVVYDRFYIFGCKRSTDIDVAVFVTESDNVAKKIDEEKLCLELAELGYDVDSRKVDVALVYMEDNVIVNTGKGGKEVQNFILATHGCHLQKYDLPINPEFEYLPINCQDKVCATGKYIPDNLKTFMDKETYKSVRTEKINSYQGPWNRVDFSITMIPLICEFAEEYSIKIKWRKAIKSITMKICQLIAIGHKIDYTHEFMLQLYSKDGLATLISNMFEEIDYRDIHWFLFWREEGTYDANTLKFLFDQYAKISNENRGKILYWQPMSINLEQNDTTMSDELYQEFVVSPDVPTDRFKEMYAQEFEYKDTSSFAQDPAFDKNSSMDAIPQKIRTDHVIEEEQRSDEWKRLLKFYKCGKDTGIKDYDGDDWVNQYFNLIRGNVIETVAIQTIDWESLYPLNRVSLTAVGLLVEQKDVESSPGIAPDLLLILDGKQIVPIEIKCVNCKSFANPAKDGNRFYRRATDLASRQIKSSMDILGPETCTEGIMCLVYVYENDDGPQVEAYISIITREYFV